MFPHESTPWYVRVTTLLTLDAPFVAESPMWVTVMAPPQLSMPVTRPTFGGGNDEKHWRLFGPGQVIDGGDVSLTVNTWKH
jgi:hypothetical protein